MCLAVLAALFFLNFLPSPRSFLPETLVVHETPVVHVKSTLSQYRFLLCRFIPADLIYDSLQLSDLGLRLRLS